MFEVLEKILFAICRLVMTSEMVRRWMRLSRKNDEFSKEYDELIHKNEIVTTIYYVMVIVGCLTWLD